MHDDRVSNPEQEELFAPAPSDPDSESVIVNDRVTMRTSRGQRVVVVDGIVVHSYAVQDRAADAYAMVLLVEAGYADQNDVARAFGHATRTVRRHQERFSQGGIAALGRPEGRPPGTRHKRLGCGRDQVVLGMKADGLSNREIGRRLGIDEKAVRKRLRRLGWAPPSQQGVLFDELEPPPEPEPDPPGGSPGKRNGEPTATTATTTTSPTATGESTSATTSTSPTASDEPSLSPTMTTTSSSVPVSETSGMPPVSLDTDPHNRWFDRTLAKLGLLDDAAPMFAPCETVPRGGVLLAVPALVHSGVLEVAASVYGKSLAPAFYGLRTTMVALVFLALLRIKRPEALKEHSPADLGKLFGLDRAPEVKTLRRKLAKLADCGQAERFGHELARRRIAERGRTVGFLYVDGHVRVYHGKHALPKAHVPQMRLSVPATTDYWVNDARGEPLFVVTAEANAGMHRMLVEITAEVRKLVGPKRRPTMVFDRGGWSPKLFAKLIADDFDVLTYRKGRIEKIPEDKFVLSEGQVDGRRVSYWLDDREVSLLKGELTLRQVTRLSGDGHQTTVLTSRKDLRAVEVAYRMFERWQQENFFKYAAEEYAIDALADYEVEPADPTRTVPNPKRKEADKTLAEARAELAKLLKNLGAAAADNPEAKRPTMRGFKIAHGKLGKQIRALRDRILTLQQAQKAVEKRVPVVDVLRGKPVVKLSTERKHLTNVLKMVAYQIESELLATLGRQYARVDEEGRTLVQATLQTTATIEPRSGVLSVRLDPLSSPHRSLAVAAACAELTDAAASFPGTSLRLRFNVSEARLVG